MNSVAFPSHDLVAAPDVRPHASCPPPVSLPRADVFRQKLPLIARIVDVRWWLLPFAAVIAAVVGSLARSPSLGWSVMLAWTVLPAIAADRPFHALSVVGPTTFAAVVLFIKFGVGLPMAVSAGLDVSNEAAFNCGCFAFTLITTLLSLLFLIGPSARQDFAIAEKLRRAETDLGRVGLALFGYSLLLDFVLINTGGLDRSLSTEKAYGYGEMGWWSWFALFQDITNMGVFLLPLTVRRWLPWLRHTVYAMVFARAAVYLLCGWRSGGLFPLGFFLLGHVAFASRLPKRLEIYTLIAGVFVFPIVDFTDYLRGSKFFHETRITDIGARLIAAGKALTTLREEDESRRALSSLVTGVALLEFSDTLIYERTPNPMPYAGFGDLHNLIYVFVPRYFMPTKPILLDGNEIVVEYSGLRQKGTAATVSLNADLYRRNGTIAVITGGFASALLLIFYLKTSIAIMRFIDPAFGLLMLLMLLSLGFRHPLFHWTVLSLGSYYLYSFPKFLIFLLALLTGSRFLHLGARSRQRFLALPNAMSVSALGPPASAFYAREK